jgi:hypothetical protein
MSISIVQILTVGPATLDTLATLKRLASSGWSSHSVATIHEAETILKTIRFNVVLAAEKLADGVGYELAPILTRQRGTLYIGVALSETCLWLPVIERGVRSLGARAMNSGVLETEVVEILHRVQHGIVAASDNSIPLDRKAVLPAHVAGALAGAFASAANHDSSAEDDSSAEFDTLLPRPGVSTSARQPTPETARLLRSTPKALIPPRRKSLERAAPSVSRMPDLDRGDAKPSTGTHGKGWRG